MIPKLIFIIPYRDRAEHKNHFDIYMKYILEDIPYQDYKIFFVHQCDQLPFNRGAMKNIGFLAMREQYPNDYKNITFIFNDIDTMPIYKNLFNYNTTHGIVKHFYGFTFALGGIFSITGGDFEKIGGFPNFWGWGLEDNNIYNKAIKADFKVDRSQFYKLRDKHIIHLFDNPYRKLSYQDVWREHTTEGMNHIKDLNYKIENEFINVLNFNRRHFFSL